MAQSKNGTGRARAPRPTKPTIDEAVQDTIDEGRRAIGLAEAFAEVDRAVELSGLDLKGRLLAPRLESEQIEIEGVGAITVRALAKAEINGFKEAAENPRVDGTFDELLMQACMVDPRLSIKEVRMLEANAPAGEVVRILKVMYRLSKMGDDDSKSGMAEVREGT